MFNNNKYTNWYYAIINNAISQNRSKGIVYYERHHVIPKSLGGNNSPSNLVLLLPREHFICHLLLMKMCTGKNKAKMVYAFMQCAKVSHTKQPGARYNSKHYMLFRNNHVNAISGENCYMFGKPKSDKTKQRISQTRKLNQLSAGKNNPMFGISHTNTAKISMSEKQKELYAVDPIRWITKNPKSVIITDGTTVFQSIHQLRKHHNITRTKVFAKIQSGEFKILSSNIVLQKPKSYNKKGVG